MRGAAALIAASPRFAAAPAADDDDAGEGGSFVATRGAACTVGAAWWTVERPARSGGVISRAISRLRGISTWGATVTPPRSPILPSPVPRRRASICAIRRTSAHLRHTRMARGSGTTGPMHVGGRRRAAGSGPAKKLPAGEPRSGEAGGPSAPPEVSHASRLNNSCEGASREERWGVAAVRSASAPGFARVQFPLELGPLLLGRQVLALLHGDRRAEPLHL